MPNQYRAEHIIAKVKDFVAARTTGSIGEFKMCAGGEITLYSSCFAAMILHYSGMLSSFSETQKEQWVAYLNHWQDPVTGLYLGPEIVPEELTSPIHDYTHVTMHLAAHVLPALNLLGGKSGHPLSFAHRFLDVNELSRWLETIDWRNAWLEGNNLLFVLQFLIHLRDEEGRTEANHSLGVFFDWLDAEVDPATGLWGTNGFCTPYHAMYGGYHQLLAYYYERRPVLFPDRLIDTVLSLQHQDGGFHPNGGGGACEDVDAVDILVNMYKRANYRHEDIRNALKRLLPSIAEAQMADGGFVYRKNESFTHLGIVKTRTPANVSNMFATWFRVHTLALIGEVLPEEPLVQYKWNFNNSCSMGWHQQTNISCPVSTEGIHSPLVSIVMSVYNGVKYIAESVKSILTQTYTNFEFIIINDGSTDGTREILESYQDERIVLIHQENMGLTKSLNKGIALAKGKYVARQDADDVSKSDRLEKQVAYMEAHPQVGLLGTRLEFIDDKGDVLRPSLLPTDNEVLQERLVRINQFCHASVLIRREALDKVGEFRDYFRYAQDYDLWLRIAEHYEIANLPDALVQYRELDDAISSEKILVQSLYAGVAAEMARKRRAGDGDDIDLGLELTLPEVDGLSEKLHKKLTDFYARRPLDLVKGLEQGEHRHDLVFLLEKLCTERLQFESSERNKTYCLEKVEGELRQRDEQLKQRDEQLKQKDEQLKQKDEHLKQRDEQLKQKDEQLKQKDEHLKQRDEQLKQRDEQLKQKDEQLKQKDEQLKQKDEQLKQKDEQLKQKDEHLKQKDEQLKQRDEQLKQKDEQLKQKDEQLKQRDEQLKQKDEQLKQKDEQLKQRDEHLKQKDEQLKQKDEQIIKYVEQVRLDGEHIRQKHEALQQKCNEIDSIYNSMSWKVTKPLRSMHEALTHVGRKNDE
jgi:glycosyltransferase involved in cell wall biosynthesis